MAYESHVKSRPLRPGEVLSDGDWAIGDHLEAAGIYPQQRLTVATTLGTRPEIIRLSKVLPLLDKLLGDRHGLFHTGQS